MILNKSANNNKHFITAFAVVTIITGTFLRFYNLNWDKGHSFHSDERNLTSAVIRIQFFSQMNPGFFSYGSFPVYLYKAGTMIAASVTHDPSWLTDWTKVTLVGRFFSAFFSSFTLFVVFLLSRRLVSPLTALLTLWFTTFMPLLIQEAHYSITESMITFWAVTLTYFCLKQLQEKNHQFHWIQSGCILGLAIATKVSSVSFILIIGAALLYFMQRLHKGSQRIYQVLLYFVGICTLSFFIYAIVSPYTFLDWQNFTKAMKFESRAVLGKDVFVTIYQFIGTKPYAFQIKQFWYTQGILVSILSVIGSVYLAYKIFRRRMWLLGFVFIWPLFYFLYVGSWFAKFVRYLVPIYPFFAIAAAIAVTDFLTILRRKTLKIISPTLASLLVILFLGVIWITPLLQAIAFFTIYTAEQSRIQASKWIYQNIPTGSKILTEHWDEGVPVPLDAPFPPLSTYQSEQLAIYEPDNDQKIYYYATKLSSADYVTINSRRLYGTLIRLTDRYPITSTYYKRLFDGTLGYIKIAQFSVYPSIKLGPWIWEINDDNAEESFQVYDHPKVIIFQNIKHLSQTEFLRILTPTI